MIFVEVCRTIIATVHHFCTDHEFTSALLRVLYACIFLPAAVFFVYWCAYGIELYQRNCRQQRWPTFGHVRKNVGRVARDGLRRRPSMVHWSCETEAFGRIQTVGTAFGPQRSPWHKNSFCCDLPGCSGTHVSTTARNGWLELAASCRVYWVKSISVCDLISLV